MSTGGRDRGVALLALLVAAAIWGATFFITREGMLATGRALDRAAGPGTGAAFGPAVFLVLRFALATACAALIPGALRGLRSPRALADALIVGAPFVLGFLLLSYGLVETTATVAAFLTSVYVLVVPALVVIVERRAPAPRLIGGAALVLAGIALMTWGGATPADAAHPPAGPAARLGRGEALSLACAAAFGVQVYLIDRVARRTPAAALTFGTMALTALAPAAALVLWPGGARALSPRAVAAVLADRDALAALAFSGILASVVALFLMYRYQSRVSPSRAAIAYAAEPAFAALFAVALGSETPGVAAVWGSCLILAGNLTAELRRASG